MTQEAPIHDKSTFEDEDSALVLNKPFEHYGVDEGAVVDYLENEDSYDAVFYVGERAGHVPVMVDTLSEDENARSDLPPGFEDGFYDGSIQEALSGGQFKEFQAAELLNEYDKVELAGATDGFDMSSKYRQLREIVDEGVWDVDARVSVNDEVQYNVFDSH